MSNRMLLLTSLAQIAIVGACASENAPSPTSPTSPAPLRVQPFVASEAGVRVTSTLITGERDAVLVDAQFIESEAARLVEMIRGTGKRLTTVYITHAHPDHYFGLPVIQAAFPEAKILASPAVAAEMKARWQAKHDQWKPIFGDDLADTQVEATPYHAPTLTLEDREIQLLGPQQGDDPHLTTLFVPGPDALIASDVSYSGTHVWLADTRPADRVAWLGTLERLAALNPAMVVSGHDDPALPDDATALGATAQYIRDFDRVLAASKSAPDVVAAMSKAYPTLALPIILDISAKAAFAGGE
jgi:glyoxylase-like metal-dependent hydrolase (beta-lactamase superfamily II)